MVELIIPCKPQGKARPKFSRVGNYVRTYTPDKTVNYENFVRFLWTQSGHEKLEGEIKACIYAHFKIPTSVSKKKHAKMLGTGYTHKPDADNICKSVLDGLQGVAFADDSQVVEVLIRKEYDDEEFVRVTLEEIVYDEL